MGVVAEGRRIACDRYGKVPYLVPTYSTCYLSAEVFYLILIDNLVVACNLKPIFDGILQCCGSEIIFSGSDFSGNFGSCSGSDFRSDLIYQ